MSYKFPVSYSSKPNIPKQGLPSPETQPDERVIIQGRSAGSKEEARVANGLEKLKHSYIYQYQILDIQGVRGAYVVDFLVTSTVPMSTPLEVFGEYWHKGQMNSQEQFRLIQIEDHFR